MRLRLNSKSRVNERYRDPGYGNQDNSRECRQKTSFTSRRQVKDEY